MNALLDHAEVVERVLKHIDEKTTDLGDDHWYEPVENYRSMTRFNTELELLRHLPIPFCPAQAAGLFFAVIQTSHQPTSVTPAH